MHDETRGPSDAATPGPDELRELLRTSLEANDLETAIEAAAQLYETTGDEGARDVAGQLVALLRDRHVREREAGGEA